jgi:hypothetical protein
MILPFPDYGWVQPGRTLIYYLTTPHTGILDVHWIRGLWPYQFLHDHVPPREDVPRVAQIVAAIRRENYWNNPHGCPHLLDANLWNCEFDENAIRDILYQGRPRIE